ncbi:MAG: hypothetical protein A2V70_07405 [Planctomycetes bacterium RBG_13_63_9]|nr:MAG: hypothetical protein A2V70_07405 [Planctomycetes bacterium RBG_13_63_9]
MQSAANDGPPPHVTATPPKWPARPEIVAREPRNLLLLAAHQTMLRLGWIFKTESVIMPAFLDWMVGPGAGWLRGFMPVLNRFGQSVPPVFCAETLGAMRRKKWALAACVALMSVPFGVLSAVCLSVDVQRLPWAPGLFLGLYCLFFVFNGLYYLSFGTVQGKLIRPTRRGRLLLVSTFWGSIPAMVFAWWLLPGWLEVPASGFGYIFAFTAVCFFLSGMIVTLLSERPDERQSLQIVRPLRSLVDTCSALRHDRNLRRLVLVAMLFGTALIVFPHYQTLARVRLGLSLEQSGGSLMAWVITQNAAVGIWSLFVGPLADAWGNRLTLRMLIFGSAIAPAAAILLSYLGGVGAALYWTVFVLLGLAPLVLRILANYTLEICEPGEHPRYLSTLALCLAIPFVFSPAVGWLVDRTFNLVFLSATALILLGGYMTFRLDEPRHRVRDEEIAALGTLGDE